MFVGRKLPPTGKWRHDQYPYQPWELDAVPYDVAGAPDIYLSMNRFEGARKVLQQHVRELAALYVDLDAYKVPALAKRGPEAVLEAALERLSGAGIPEPSLVISSGQGLYLIWLHTPVGGQRIFGECKGGPLSRSSGGKERANLVAAVGQLVCARLPDDAVPVAAVPDTVEFRRLAKSTLEDTIAAEAGIRIALVGRNATVAGLW